MLTEEKIKYIPKPSQREGKKTNGLWAYLESTGILEKGSNEEIKRAKREYKKKYILAYKRDQRASHGEFSILLSKRNGEFGKVKSAAENYNMAMTAFLKASAFAYLDKTFLVPDKTQIAKMEQLLMQTLNEIQCIACKEKEQKYELLMQQVQKMQRELSQALRHPPETTST